MKCNSFSPKHYHQTHHKIKCWQPFYKRLFWNEKRGMESFHSLFWFDPRNFFYFLPVFLFCCYSFYSFARKAVADRRRCGARHRGGWSRIRTTSLSVYLSPPTSPSVIIFCLTPFLPLAASFFQPRTLSFLRTCARLTTHFDSILKKKMFNYLFILFWNLEFRQIFISVGNLGFVAKFEGSFWDKLIFKVIYVLCI